MSVCFDLHCHSTASDGRLTPTDLVRLAVKRGVNVLALTDHDTCEGLAEARAEAELLGLRLINGVEVSANWTRKTYHIVGLGVDPECQELRELLTSTGLLRVRRSEMIAEQLERKGISGALAAAQQMADGGLITRSHFARLLLERGLVSSIQGAFDKYLGQGKPAYVPMPWPELERVIRAIKAAGGQAVLAHPMRYDLTASWRRRLLEAFVALGGEALEVVYGTSDPMVMAASADYAKRYGLKASVGSDYHGPDNPWVHLGALKPLPLGLTPVWADWPL